MKVIPLFPKTTELWEWKQTYSQRKENLENGSLLPQTPRTMVMEANLFPQTGEQMVATLFPKIRKLEWEQPQSEWPENCRVKANLLPKTRELQGESKFTPQNQRIVW